MTNGLNCEILLLIRGFIMPTKKKLKIGDCFEVKDSTNGTHNSYSGYYFKITSIFPGIALYRGIYASFCEPATQNIEMGPYFQENLKPITKTAWNEVRKDAVNKLNDSYAILSKDDKDSVEGNTGTKKTPKKKSRKSSTKAKSKSKVSKLDILRQRVTDLNETATTLSGFMNKSETA